MRTVAIRSGPLVLEGGLAAPQEPRAGVVLLHGIPAGAPAPDDRGYAGLAETFATRGYAALHFTFRGARGTSGDLSFTGWQRDAEAAVETLATQAPGLPLILVGSSAGGCVGIAVAAGHPEVAAVATLAAPASFDGIGSDLRGALQRLRNSGLIHDPAFPRDPQAWWREFQDSSAERLVARVAPRPLLIVHGDADDVVPYPHAERLFAAAREPKELVRLPHGAHQLRRDPRAIDAVLDWADHLSLVAHAG